MRIVIFAASWMLVCVCEAAGFPGVYALDQAYGRITAKLDQKGGRLTGTVDFMGKARMSLSGEVHGNRASGTLAAKDGTGVFEAVVQGDVLTLTIAQSSDPDGRLAGIPLQLNRVGSAPAIAAPEAAPSAAIGDLRLVGAWTYEEILTAGNASQASEERMEFGADGSYAYARTGAGAGPRSRSFGTRNRDTTERTAWRADAGVLYLLRNDGWVLLGRYVLSSDGQALRITYRAGNRKLWSRR